MAGTKKDDLDRFLKKTGVSILTLFQGALELTVRNLTGRTDFVYMNIYDGRVMAGLENTQGVLAKAVFVRALAKPDMAVREYLAGIQENYQNLVYYDVVDTPELIRKYPHIRSGICLNFRTKPEAQSLNGKPLRWNEEYVQELLEAHKAFTVFDLSIDNTPDGEEHFGRIVSAKASPWFVDSFLSVYDQMLVKLMEAERLEQILDESKT